MALVVLLLSGGQSTHFGLGALKSDAPDPFSYKDSRAGDLQARAAAGYAHVVYAKSPGGVEATAARVARSRTAIEAGARGAGVDPDMLEAVVFLESAGRPDAVAGRRLSSATGLTQILAQTGQTLLGMHVDLAASRRLTRGIRLALARGQTRRARALAVRRRRVDERFDPGKSLAATGRYLRLARQKLGGREDLAFVSYHMGIGNLQGVLREYGGGDAVPYVKLFFDSTPAHHRTARHLLDRFGDDSSTYLWRLLACREVMRLWRTDRGKLHRRARLQTARASAEEVLHPPDTTKVFADPGRLEDAYRAGELRPFPNEPASNGLRRDPGMGSLAPGLGAPRRLYRGLRPQAYALGVYMAELVREYGGGTPLTVTSTARDVRYQRLLAGSNGEATEGYSLHTTGFAFDVLRRYRNRRQALAFQAALDRLQALNLIAWAREPHAIHVTASSDARVLEKLLDEG